MMQHLVAPRLKGTRGLDGCTLIQQDLQGPHVKFKVSL